MCDLIWCLLKITKKYFICRDRWQTQSPSTWSSKEIPIVSHVSFCSLPQCWAGENMVRSNMLLTAMIPRKATQSSVSNVRKSRRIRTCKTYRMRSRSCQKSIRPTLSSCEMQQELVVISTWQWNSATVVTWRILSRRGAASFVNSRFASFSVGSLKVWPQSKLKMLCTGI